MKKLFLVLMLVLAVAFSFADEVKNPTVLVKASIGEPETLDPAYAYDTGSGEIINNVGENLIMYDGEKLTQFLPMLATTVPSVENGLIRDNGLTYEFPIRKGVYFHNGELLTPKDVEFTFERNMLASQFGGPMWMVLEPLTGYQYLEDAVPAYVGASWDEIFDENREPRAEYKDKVVQFFYDVIDPAVEVVGDSVIFHLAIPYGPFLNVLAQNANWGIIMNEKFLKEVGAWDGNADGWWTIHDLRTEDSPLYATVMGTGAFKFVEWDREQKKVVLERNDNYWRTPAKLEKVIIQVYEEWSTRKAALEAGDVDILNPDTQYLPQLRDREAEGIKVYEGMPTVSVDVLGMLWTINEESKFIGSGKLDGEGIPVDFFSEPNVRRGFAAAFDYNTFIAQLLNGNAIQPAGALPQGLLGFNADAKKNVFDLDLARTYFKRAYRGQLWNKGFFVNLTYNEGNDTRKAAMEMLKENLALINPKFRAEVIALPWPDYVASRRSSTAPINFFSWLADYPDPHNFIATYYNSNSGYYAAFMGDAYAKFATKPQPDFGGVSLNDYIDMALKADTPEERQKMYEKIVDFAVKNAINIPTYQSLANKSMRTWVQGWYRNPMQGGNDYYYVLSKELK